MRTWIAILTLSVLAFATLAAPALAVPPPASVTYRLYHYEGGNWVEYGPNATLPSGGDQPGTNLWRYTYELCNLGFSSALYDLDVFFNSDNLPCATLVGSTQPASWTGTQLGPFPPDVNWRRRFKTLLSSARVGLGTCKDTYSVDFTWVCQQLPGAQVFDAIAYGSGSYSAETVSGAPVPVESSTWGQLKSLYR